MEATAQHSSKDNQTAAMITFFRPKVLSGVVPTNFFEGFPTGYALSNEWWLMEEIYFQYVPLPNKWKIYKWGITQNKKDGMKNMIKI